MKMIYLLLSILIFLELLTGQNFAIVMNVTEYSVVEGHLSTAELDHSKLCM